MSAGPRDTDRREPRIRDPETRDAQSEATRRQEIASHPAHSAWVSANAGSGKTHVLARRVVRLLLAGTAPGRILCLTYTKAAAANMANRVLKILGEWVGLSDAALDAALRATDNAVPTPALRARARRLFAAALETPGGLKIQTIHAFCGALLHRFPFEAGVAAGFKELDDAGRAEVMARLRSQLIVEAAGDPSGPLGAALFQLMEDVSDAGISAMLDKAVAERAGIAGLGAGAAERRAGLARLLGLPADISSARVRAAMLESPHLPRAAWAETARLIAAVGSANDLKRAAALAAAAEALADEGTGDEGAGGEAREAAALSAYLDVFFNSDRKPRASVVTQAVAKADPPLAARMADERDRLAALEDQLRGARVLERTLAAHALGAEIGRRYGSEKAARGLLDFDDLVLKASALLNTVPASFVHYKLDQGIDHVLVDEAQDTSPTQWDVVKGLTSDFFSGAGAREAVTRTVFVVGDEKQSIFSFQGADPSAFGGMRAQFARQTGAAAFREVRLPHSFRSAPGVLEAVDEIFRHEAAYGGLTLESVPPPPHPPIRANAPALVEIWPTIQPEPRPEGDNWRRPLDAVPSDDPVNGLAARIAGFVQAGIAQGLSIPSRGGRPMRAGDVLVLVRRRGKVFEAVIRALKDLNDARVAVAGADRLVVAEHIAAMDLMALGDALLSPDDDLALASVLKSPLFGFSDDDLMEWCPGREGRLGDALAARAGADARLCEALSRLARWQADARALRPFDFYARVLGRDGGRRAFLARLGPEAADAISEFMTLARGYEQWEAASLPGFLAFLRRGGAEVKRDMESERDEVRVMTVHGAKGLEAPIVILADTVDLPRPRTEGGFLLMSCAQGPDIPVLAPRRTEDPPLLAAAREAAAGRELAEYRRLLYVALTRAEDALVVCGAETGRLRKDKDHARPDGCWYELVRAALAHDAEEGPALGFDGAVLRWRKGPGLGRVGADAAHAGPAEPEPLEAFAPLRPSGARRLLRPSRAAGDAPGAITGGRGQAEPGSIARLADLAPAAEVPALLRGDLVHRLLALLPGLADPEREAAGSRFLDHVGAGLGAGARADILAEALGVVRHEPIADLFGPGSLAEVPILGALAGADGTPWEVSGRIDRLAEVDGRLLLADFKTDRQPADTLADLDPAYVDQLATYAAVLLEAMPGRAVEARLVFTRRPSVVTVPQATLDLALRRLLSLTSA